MRPATTAFLAASTAFIAAHRAKAPPEPNPPPWPENVHVFGPGDVHAANETISAVYAVQRGALFGDGRHALMFRPGRYPIDVPVGARLLRAPPATTSPRPHQAWWSGPWSSKTTEVAPTTRRVTFRFKKSIQSTKVLAARSGSKYTSGLGK